MRLRRLLALAAAAGLAGATVVYRQLAPPEAGFYLDAALQLFGVVIVIILVAALLVFAALKLAERAGRPVLTRSLPAFLGWNILKSKRPTETLRSRLRRGARWLVAARPMRRSLLFWLVVGGLGIAAALLLGMVRPAPWRLELTLLAGFGRAAGLLVVAVAAIALVGGLTALALRRRPDPVARERDLRPRNMVTTPTFIAIVGVAVGVWALIVVLSVMTGFESDLRTKILQTQDHVQIVAQAAEGEQTEDIQDPLKLADELVAIDGVAAAFPYLQGEVMLSSPTNISTSLALKGFDPQDLEASHHLTGAMRRGGPALLRMPDRLLPDADSGAMGGLSPLSDILQNGKANRARPGAPLRNAGDAGLAAIGLPARVFPGILIGEELANSLNVDVGAELQVIAPEGGVGPAGVMPKSKSFRVAGVFNTGMYEYDMKLAYVALAEAQRFFDRGAGVNRVEVRLVSTEDTEAVLARITTALAGRKLQALDWKALNRSLFTALQLEKMVMFIVLGFIILVASFAIFASLFMIVMEKSREIAILKAMGATAGTVRQVFISLGLFIGVVGTGAGTLLGLGSCALIYFVGFRLPKAYYIEFIPVRVDGLEVVAIVAAAIGLCLLSTLYPSTAASRLRPVEGLRYE